MKQVLGIAALAAALGASSVAVAQQKPEDVIKFRKSLYTVVGWHNAQMGAMVKGQQPFDQKIFVRNSALIEQLSQVAPAAFAPGSDKGETRAKPEIWQQPDKFNEAMQRFQGEATKLSEVSKQGNPDQIRNQFGALAKACSNCHDQFRTK